MHAGGAHENEVSTSPVIVKAIRAFITEASQEDPAQQDARRSS
jgi:hypothetical protein